MKALLANIVRTQQQLHTQFESRLGEVKHELTETSAAHRTEFEKFQKASADQHEQIQTQLAALATNDATNQRPDDDTDAVQHIVEAQTSLTLEIRRVLFHVFSSRTVFFLLNI